MGNDLMRIANTYYNNSLENIGNHDSFVWYGPRWAQAATAPHKLYKSYSTEGGIRVPFVLNYPRAKTAKGTTVRSFATVMDLAPTILDLAGLKHPVPPQQEKGRYRGRDIYGMRGHSWFNAFASTGWEQQIEALHGPDTFVGWELAGKAALRKGKWKITYLGSKQYGNDRFELYDLDSDPGERVDLSAEHPEKYREMLADFDQYVRETHTIWPPSLLTGDGSVLPRRDGRAPVDAIGGDPIEQCTAWMEVGDGKVARPTLPMYDHIPNLPDVFAVYTDGYEEAPNGHSNLEVRVTDSLNGVHEVLA